MATLRFTRRPWVFVCPIRNLVLDQSMGGELQVHRVQLVSSAKVRLIRRRLGLPVRVSALPGFIRKKLGESETLAFLRPPIGTPDALEPQLWSEVNQACHLLLASSWPYLVRSRRLYLSAFGPPGSSPKARRESSFICRQKAAGAASVEISHTSEWRVGVAPFRIDSEWISGQGFFYDLMGFLSDTSGVSKEWQQTVLRATACVGQSLKTIERGMALLLDFIALDALLLLKGERSSPTLYDRLAVLMGWTPAPDGTPLFTEKELSDLCDLRHRLVHDGDSSDVKARDLVLADFLVLNLLANVSRLRSEIRSKEELLQLEQRVSARQLLGYDPYRGERAITQHLSVSRPRTSPKRLAELDRYMS